MSNYQLYTGSLGDLTEKYKNAFQTANITSEDLKNPDIPISKLIYYNDLNAVKQKISDWVAARLTARHVFVPNWSDLIRVFDYVWLDAHVFGIQNGIKQKIKGKEFVIKDAKGEIDKEITQTFKTKWFSKYQDIFVESFFYPYSLVELGEYVDGKFPDLQMVKREYIVPQYRSVKVHLNAQSVPKYVQHWPQAGVRMDPFEQGDYLLIWFEDPIRINDYVWMPCPLHDLGLLDIAAPHALGKMGSLSYFLDYLQKFVVPFRHGKTNINDNPRRTNMDRMMSAWGASGYAVTDLEDEISILEQSGSTTAPFVELFKYSNNEISKAFTSAVGVFDEKNFVGSAEAGERMLDAIVKSYCREFEYNANDELLPRMALRDLKYSNKTFEYVDKEVISYQQRVDAVVKLGSVFKLDAEEVSKKTDFKLKEKQIPSQLTQLNQGNNNQKNIVPSNDMVENTSRAMKWVSLKNLTVPNNVANVARKIMNNEVLTKNDIEVISNIKESDKPYAKTNESVIFDLVGGKAGKDLIK